MTTAIILVACLALLSIAFEEVIHINKAKTTLFFGCFSWLFLFIAHHGEAEQINTALNENLLDIASLWLFLVATMTFVAYLNGRGLISTIVSKVMPGKLSLKGLTILIALLGVLLSMLCDNITATLVLIGIIQSFKLTTAERVRLCVLAVFAINSGGVVLITGDVTTLMIFSSGYLSIEQLLGLIIPAFAGVFTLMLLMLMYQSRTIEAEHESGEVYRIDIFISVLFFTTIVSTMILSVMFAIPPVLTFLSGLSVMFMTGAYVNKYRYEVHLLEYVREIQFDTLMFFLGILLIVGALKEVGVLIWVTEFYLLLSPEISSFIMGVLSSLLDNVPLTAALLKAQPELTSNQWLGLAYGVGVGGSMLVIGSAAGIVAMSRVKELSFFQYARYLPHLFVAYAAGYLVTIYSL
ncbi:sodium:proton antiporter NhaD [Aliikangiella maris]|uniref:Sodium:proton antiporter NhaD n=2 Tax=Aliikangiella maris TaxID=3162458 RepID=A0ABV2BXZ5_9GAMM